MIAAHNLRQSEFREEATTAILKMLAELPETQRNIFIWNHYCSYQPKQIAEILRCSPRDVETTLDLISSTLYQRTRSLLADRSEVSKN
jgi:DNA-directed RNA polymerase specialized sigma24 family protein